ncbi:MAG: transaldolase family protein [Anaerolineaceae bacterium]
MSLYLDSATLDEIKEAFSWGWVSGVTTNPALLGKSEVKPEERLKAIANLVDGEIFYQLMAETPDGMYLEAHRARDILGTKLVVKIPATAVGFRSCARLTPEFSCAMTAVYSPAQALLAAESGARYVIVYFNRAASLMGDADLLTSACSQVLADGLTELMAASIKSIDDAVSAVKAGAMHLTLPFDVLKTLPENELTRESVLEFNKIGKGINY